MKKRVGVIFGGRSVEHEISVLTGIQVMDALDVEKYEIVPIYISQTGQWYSGNKLREKDFYKGLPASFSKVEEVDFSPVPGKDNLFLKKRGVFGGVQALPVDVFLPIFHGQYGEDGCIQGLFELAGVAYGGPQVLAASVAMNKYICKSYLAQHGVPVLPSLTLLKAEAQDHMNEACKKIMAAPGLEKFPLFIKPGNLGSSVGVGRARDENELIVCLAKVFQLDDEAIIEPCITNLMEINVSVIEGKGVEPDISVVEIPVASGEFLSYEDKYLRGGKGKKGGSSGGGDGMAGLTRVIDPDNLDPKYKEGVQSFASKSFKLLGASGVVRFDFMVNLDTEELFFNELNVIPGSLAFYLWERSKPVMLFSDILDRLIEGAEKRCAQREQLQRDIGFKALK